MGRPKRIQEDVLERAPDKSVDTRDVSYSRGEFLSLAEGGELTHYEMLNSAIVMRDGEKLKLPTTLEGGGINLEMFGFPSPGVILLNTEICELLRDYGFVGELGGPLEN